ncbi:cobalt-precorrin-6A reductase [Acuticoccus sediminis]|uniref:Cobalt-precorrin-6A reductase n=1 Tax=Acuticoccus sediminis TaxID=2184697 RepID=A0A8B2P2N0_9HYPH|nr:cobalt-precorrin-6A reductase [Acuticoccus sediminis]RAI04406.1 cobalt-precorrin-6A reductase [Acuticoccus sediminis]
MARILLLGGTEEARRVAEMLDEKGASFIVSLASASASPYPGPERRGGFGGEDAMVRYLENEGVEVVADATHPFAAEISPMAKRAAKRAKVRYLRLERRPWRRSAADRWIDVRSLEEAAAALDNGSDVFLTVGAHSLQPFLMRRDLRLVVRTIEKPDLGTRRDVTVIRDRGPFSIEDERALFARYQFDAMVTKNSGGDATAAKLVAARERRMLVYMVQRPRGQPWVNCRTPEQLVRRLRWYI